MIVFFTIDVCMLKLVLDPIFYSLFGIANYVFNQKMFYFFTYQNFISYIFEFQRFDF